MKKILFIILLTFCFQTSKSQTTVESFLGMSLAKIERMFINDTSFISTRILANKQSQIYSITEGQIIRFFFDDYNECDSIMFATDNHEIANSLIDDNTLNYGTYNYINNLITWNCNNKFQIILKFYSEDGYPFQFIYFLK